VSAGSAVLTVGAAFFVAELGDKTMLATVTLAAEGSGPAGTWAGSTLGMVAADALAIVVGKILSQRLPERTIKYGAAALFALFGIVLLFEGVNGLIG
jgi:putative Ca2+/H+ antiporter (TMEM165/GDT1 family)